MFGVLAKSAMWLGLFAAGMMSHRIIVGTVYVAPGDYGAYWPFVVAAIFALMLMLGPRGRA